MSGARCRCEPNSPILEVEMQCEGTTEVELVMVGHTAALCWLCAGPMNLSLPELGRSSARWRATLSIGSNAMSHASAMLDESAQTNRWQSRVAPKVDTCLVNVQLAGLYLSDIPDAR